MIRTHPGVRDVAVLGRPDPDDGELPMAFVVLEPGVTASKQDIIQLVKGESAFCLLPFLFLASTKYQLNFLGP